MTKDETISELASAISASVEKYESQTTGDIKVVLQTPGITHMKSLTVRFEGSKAEYNAWAVYADKSDRQVEVTKITERSIVYKYLDEDSTRRMSPDEFLAHHHVTGMKAVPPPPK